ncbi:hypothetical protein ACTXT7_011519 [Hymenolepis weldensis]
MSAVSSKVLPTGRSSEKVTNLMHPIKASMPKVIPARLAAMPTMPIQQSVQNPNTQIVHHDRTPQNVLFRVTTFEQNRCSFFRHKQSPPANDKCRQPEKIDLAKPVFLVSVTVSKSVARNASETAFPFHQDLKSSQTNVPWSHIDLSLAGPIRGISLI